jgi:hypothetical protein
VRSAISRSVVPLLSLSQNAAMQRPTIYNHSIFNF